MLNDMLQYLRMANIFGPQMPGNDLPEQGGITGTMIPNMSGAGPMSPDQATIAPNVPAPQPVVGGTTPGQPDYDPSARMAQIYKPETQAEDRFGKLTASMPKRQDYEPSVMRRIGGALMAFSGGMAPGRGLNFYHANPNAIQGGINFLDKPYADAMSDWEAQIKPAEQAANLERQSNVNARTLAYQTVSQELRDRAQDEKSRNDERKAAISEKRASVYEFKAHNPGAKFDFKGPTVLVADPITGKVTDTGVETGSLTELDKLNLQHENKVGEIQESGSQQRQTEGVRQQGREQLNETRGWKPYEETLPDGTKRTFMYNEITGETRDRAPGGSPNARPVSRTGAGGGKPETPTQTRVRQFNAARELFNTRPDLRPFIKLGTPGANDFSITPPGKGFFGGATGPNKDQLEELNTAIYGNPQGMQAPQMATAHTPGATPAPSSTPAPATPTAAAPVAPKGRVIIYKNGKAVGSIPANQVEDAKKAGYEVR